MSHSDFFKQLFLAAVQGGQIRADSDVQEVQRILHALMEHYLESAQTVGRENRRLRDREPTPAPGRRRAGSSGAGGNGAMRRGPRHADAGAGTAPRSRRSGVLP